MRNEKNRMKWVAALWTAAAVVWAMVLLLDVVYDRHTSGGLAGVEELPETLRRKNSRFLSGCFSENFRCRYPPARYLCHVLQIRRCRHQCGW